MKQVKILIGICSASGYENRRESTRNTWMMDKVDSIEEIFFIGERDNMEDSDLEFEDLVVLKSDDSYDFLPEKVMCFFAWALENYDFEWLFKCDDDTYVKKDRLLSLIDIEYDLIGNEYVRHRNSPSGGAGYLLSRKLVQSIVNSRHKFDKKGFEDVIYGQYAYRNGFPMKTDLRLIMKNDPFPLDDNDIITCHWCSDDRKKFIYDFNAGNIDKVFKCFHKFWEDIIYLFKDGTFMRKGTSCNGIWGEFDGGVSLQWKRWPAEKLTKKGNYYYSPEIIILELDDYVNFENLHKLIGDKDKKMYNGIDAMKVMKNLIEIANEFSSHRNDIGGIDNE